VYVFRSPQNANNVVLIATVHPAFTPAAGALFDPNGRYEFLVSNNGDLVADLVVTVTFSNEMPQRFTIQGLTATPLTGTVTEPGMADQIAQDGGVTALCGVKDDPFFFDLDGFQAFTAGPYIPDQGGLRGSGGLAGPPQNFFGTLNVAAIVIECPVTQLTGGVDANSGTIQVWAKTFGS
ncbi:MAG: DUF4331 family protein, partial [Planctomycetes bacterium]|nr:DUF4331 family protein [Planctomycetota bacterium]